MARYVKLERPVHYGNVGQAFKESKPPDDPYLFPPENTRDVWAHAKQITDRYGFSLYADEQGDFVLSGRNNPTRIVDFVDQNSGKSALLRSEHVWVGSTLGLHPNAYAGTFLEFTGAVSATDIVVNAARIDLILPLGTDGAASLGQWQVTVYSGTAAVSSLVIDPTLAGTLVDEELHYYDYRALTDGTNAAVVTLHSSYFGEYTVRLSSYGGTGSTVRRLDGFQLWAVDPNNPLLATLSTSTNATKAQALSAADEHRNYVIVVGRRQAAVTDSDKLKSTAFNPSSEYVVASAVDVESIAMPVYTGTTEPNSAYVGGIRETLIYDDKVADQDFAEYLARTFIYRYRMPLGGAQVSHTLLPPVQLRDPVYVDEPTYGTLDGEGADAQVRWINSIRHEIQTAEGGVKAQTDMELSAYPDYPSYAPREDIDIDRFYNGMPVTNVSVSYTSLSNHTITNVAASAAKNAPSAVSVGPVSAGMFGVLSLSGQLWPPVPGTVFLTATSASYSTYSETARSSVKYIYYGGSTDAIYLINPAPATAITSVIVYWRQAVYDSNGMLSYQLRQATAHTSKQAAVAEIQLDNTKGYWYEYDENDMVVRVYRAPLSPLSIPLGWIQPVNMYAEVTYNAVPTAAAPMMRRQTNTPYQELFAVDYNSPALTLTWKRGDQTEPYAPPTTAGTTGPFTVEYRPLLDGTGDYGSALALDGQTRPKSPFYDPYTSELGELVSVSFDALVSGLYRISIRSRYDDTVVAWLTNATAEPSDEDAHWQYFTAGKDRKLYWDGVDHVGDWNIRQSTLYGDMAKSVFPGEDRPIVGKGFYVWNREERGADTQALISGLCDASGKPVFGHGTYAEWYVYFEVTNEWLEALYELYEDENAVRQNSTTVQDRTAVRYYSTKPGQGPIEGHDGLVYTHLPHPTRVTVSWADWVGPPRVNGQPFDESNLAAIRTPGNWTTSDSDDAVINNRSPVRLRFTMLDRPGVLWQNKADEQSVRLFRTVHLRRNLMDQFVLFTGAPMKDKDAPYEIRRVVSRRGSNDDNTWTFADDGYRLGSSFATDSVEGTEWIFMPKHCEKDFRGAGTESLRFADYLQLDEVPEWDPTNPIGGKHSRFQIAFINDLFYLSVYTQDRSGRYQWCIDDSFVDQSKILYNGATMQWPDDSITQHRRFVLCRQWSNELVNGTEYGDYLQSTWGSDPLIARLARHYWADHAPDSTELSGVSYSALSSDLDTDLYTEWHAEAHSKNIPEVPHSWNDNPSGGPAFRQLKALGSWSWESSPTWAPSILRDFHGYYCIPPMIDGVRFAADLFGINPQGTSPKYLPVYSGGEQVSTRDWSKLNCYGAVYRAGEYDVETNTGRDLAELTIWQSRTFDNTEASVNNKRFWGPGSTLETKSSDANFTSKELNYSREDYLVHYEELRGLYTRGPRPEEAPKKLDSVGPYYQNVFTYGTVRAYTSQGYATYGLSKSSSSRRVPARYEAVIRNFFMMTFRTRYVYESAGLFPATQNGALDPSQFNARLARLSGQNEAKARYDGGAWTGWKDEWEYNDGALPRLYFMRANEAVHGARTDSVFDHPWMPWAPCSRLPVTRKMLFHLALVNERRDVPV